MTYHMPWYQTHSDSGKAKLIVETMNSILMDVPVFINKRANDMIIVILTFNSCVLLKTDYGI